MKLLYTKKAKRFFFSSFQQIYFRLYWDFKLSLHDESYHGQERIMIRVIY